MCFFLFGRLSLAIFLVLLTLGLALRNPAFASPTNLRDVCVNASHLGIAALGMFLVILIGQIDVSVGAILAICSTLAGLLAKQGVPTPVVVVAAMLAGALLGGLNGLIVAGLRIHSIVVTLGTASIYRGLLIQATGGSWIYGLPSQFTAFGQGKVLSVPNPVITLIIIYLIAAFLLSRLPAGRALFAVGSNPDASRLAGLPVAGVQILAFVVNGALVGLAAVVFASRFTVIQSNAGIGFEFAAITAVLVGGANIFGGSGTVFGTLLGTLVISALASALVFLRINSLWEPCFQGLFILAAVILDRVRRPAAAST
jgi:ribose/xylose/arabinose/galactoside ABC-type transport system permease subunit